MKIIRVNQDTYMLDTESGLIHSDALGMVDAMIRFGVDPIEIETGLVSLVRNGHHIAEYGVNKSFLFSRAISDVLKN